VAITGGDRFVTLLRHFAGDPAGKPIFNQIIEFRDRTTADRFNEMVIALVRAADPTLPDGEKVNG
jgi:hypothetical protein